MSKKNKHVRLGAITATSRPGFKVNKGNPFTWEFYIRPNSDEANEKIAMYLKHFGDSTEFERSVQLPDYPNAQSVYAIKKYMVEDIEKNGALRGLYRAFVLKTLGGKIFRHRSPEQLEKARKRKLRKELKKTRPSITTPAI